jgi:hypothetical protein
MTGFLMILAMLTVISLILLPNFKGYELLAVMIELDSIDLICYLDYASLHATVLLTGSVPRGHDVVSSL